MSIIIIPLNNSFFFLQVLLVDYGHVDSVPSLSLQSLKKSLGSIECFAERCHLADIMPAGSIDRSKWSNTAKEFVLQQIKDKRLFVKVEVCTVTFFLHLFVNIVIYHLKNKSKIENCVAPVARS